MRIRVCSEVEEMDKQCESFDHAKCISFERCWEALRVDEDDEGKRWYVKEAKQLHGTIRLDYVISLTTTNDATSRWETAWEGPTWIHSEKMVVLKDWVRLMLHCFTTKDIYTYLEDLMGTDQGIQRLQPKSLLHTWCENIYWWSCWTPAQEVLNGLLDLWHGLFSGIVWLDVHWRSIFAWSQQQRFVIQTRIPDTQWYMG